MSDVRTNIIYEVLLLSIAVFDTRQTRIDVMKMPMFLCYLASHKENKRETIGWKKLQIKFQLLRAHKKLRILGSFLRQATQKHWHFHDVYTCLASIEHGFCKYFAL